MPRLIKAAGNARRQMSFGDFGGLTKKRPEKGLTRTINYKAGRDDTGRVSVRHKGGRAKRLYRLVDFKFQAFEGVANVLAIEYDPNRSAFIALVDYPVADNMRKKAYIIAPEGLKVGDTITSSRTSTKEYKTGTRLRLADIPVGYEIHAVELQPGRGAQLARSAGSAITLTAKEGKYAYLRMPSSEIRKVLLECLASIGRVSNPTHNRIRIANAGRKRHMGVRPSVRGKAMYPAAHPHGGGEGVNPIGMKHPKTPWGKPALGVRTRKNRRTDALILSRRKKKR